jgi:Ca2+-binding EF-hand superfamily protein
MRDMKRLLTWVCLFGFLAAVMGGASAEEPKKEKKKPDLAANFKKLDKNGDEKLSKEELVGKKVDEAKAKAEKLFTTLDTDKDGSLTLTEFTTRKAPKKPKDQ